MGSVHKHKRNQPANLLNKRAMFRLNQPARAGCKTERRECKKRNYYDESSRVGPKPKTHFLFLEF